jgi:hypothetical protein
LAIIDKYHHFRHLIHKHNRWGETGLPAIETAASHSRFLPALDTRTDRRLGNRPMGTVGLNFDA